MSTVPDSTSISPHAGGQRPTVLAAMKEAFGHRGFLAVFAVLLLAAVGLNATVGFMKLHFRKEPVSMAMKFSEAIPPSLGRWVLVARDTIDAEMQAQLGTDQFLFCHFINAGSEAGAARLLQEVSRLDFKGQLKLVERHNDPSGVVNLMLTYYTGKADTVAHIPERCYVASGMDSVDAKVEQWQIDRLGPDLKPIVDDLGIRQTRTISVRFITFTDSADSRRPPQHVAYLFHVNGEYTHDSLVVRRRLQSLLERKGYYAKVEMKVACKDVDDARSSMKQLLAAALPHIEKCWPDWEKVTAASR